MAKTRVALPHFSGAKLLRLRAERGLLQQDLSNRTVELGFRVSRESISRYENGLAFPSPRSFGALVKALACEPAALLDEESAA